MLYSYRLRNVSGYRRCTHVYVYALCSSSYAYPFLSRLFFLRYFVAIFHRARSSRAKDPPTLSFTILRFYENRLRMARDTLCARYVKVSHVRRLAHESAMDLVAPGIEDVRATYKKQENSRGVGWPRRGKEGKKRRSTLVAYIFYGAITSNPYLRFVQFCPSVQPSLFLTFSSSPLLTAYCFLPG